LPTFATCRQLFRARLYPEIEKYAHCQSIKRCAMSRESNPRRGQRIVRMLATGDISPLLYALWLRWHRLEFGFADEISPEDGNSHQLSGGPALEKVLRSLVIPRNSVVIDLGVGTGIAAITLSRHFHRVLGVELSPKLVAAAKRNLSRVSVKNIEVF